MSVRGRGAPSVIESGRADELTIQSILRLKEQLEKLKRNQERRLARKNAKLGIQAGAMGVGNKRAVKTETVRQPVYASSRCPRAHVVSLTLDRLACAATAVNVAT